MLCKMLKKLLFLITLFASLSAETTTPVVVLGGGIAGMSAALQISQAGLKPLVIVGPMPGGIITVSHDVQNWPGDFFITGPDLADKLEQQLEKRGVPMMMAEVTSSIFQSAPLPFMSEIPSSPMKLPSLKLMPASLLLAPLQIFYMSRAKTLSYTPKFLPARPATASASRAKQSPSSAAEKARLSKPIIFLISPKR